MIYDNIIIGGGLAGLSALHQLIKKNRNVLLLEKNEQVGGLVQSFKSEGFLIESGPTAFLKKDKDIMSFVEELGMSDELLFNIPGCDSRYIYRNKKIHPIPEGPLSFIFTPLFSLKSKLRIMCEPFIGRSKCHEESVYLFGKRRFGEDVSVTVMDPMVSGVCAGDFRKLDIISLFPKIGMLEKKFRSFLLFLLLFKLKSKEKNRDNSSVTFRGFRKGMGAIAQRASQLYKDHILTNFNVDFIEIDNDVYTIKSNGKCFKTKNLVMACPANVTAHLLSGVHKSLSSELSKIPYSSITTCVLGYKKEQVAHSMKGFGFLVPRNSGVRILGGLFISGLFELRAPKGYVSVKIYIGGTHDTDIQLLSESEILKEVSKELAQILKINGKPCFSHIAKINSAIPQYNLGHQSIKKSIYRELKELPALSLAGNYLEGISVNEAIRSGSVI